MNMTNDHIFYRAPVSVKILQLNLWMMKTEISLNPAYSSEDLDANDRYC